MMAVVRQVYNRSGHCCQAPTIFDIECLFTTWSIQFLTWKFVVLTWLKFLIYLILFRYFNSNKDTPTFTFTCSVSVWCSHHRIGVAHIFQYSFSWSQTCLHGHNNVRYHVFYEMLELVARSCVTGSCMWHWAALLWICGGCCPPI